MIYIYIYMHAIYKGIKKKERDGKMYLSNKAFESGEFVHGESHLAHVVSHIGRATESIRSNGVG